MECYYNNFLLPFIIDTTGVQYVEKGATVDSRPSFGEYSETVGVRTRTTEMTIMLMMVSHWLILILITNCVCVPMRYVMKMGWKHSFHMNNVAITFSWYSNCLISGYFSTCVVLSIGHWKGEVRETSKQYFIEKLCSWYTTPKELTWV